MGVGLWLGRFARAGWVWFELVEFGGTSDRKQGQSDRYSSRSVSTKVSINNVKHVITGGGDDRMGPSRPQSRPQEMLISKLGKTCHRSVSGSTEFTTSSFPHIPLTATHMTCPHPNATYDLS